MSARWTVTLVKELHDQVVAGRPTKELEAQYGVQWQTLYKVLVRNDLYPKSLPPLGVVTLKEMHAEWLSGTHINELAKRVGLTSVALRSRWKRLKLKTHLGKPARFPHRRIAWKLGLAIWTMRGKGKSTQQICEALNIPFEGTKSARYIRHHLLRWCYDTHTKVPSFEYGTFKVKWLPPPTKPPTG